MLAVDCATVFNKVATGWILRSGSCITQGIYVIREITLQIYVIIIIQCVQII